MRVYEEFIITSIGDISQQMTALIGGQEVTNKLLGKLVHSLSRQADRQSIPAATHETQVHGSEAKDTAGHDSNEDTLCG